MCLVHLQPPLAPSCRTKEAGLQEKCCSKFLLRKVIRTVVQQTFLLTVGITVSREHFVANRVETCGFTGGKWLVENLLQFFFLQKTVDLVIIYFCDVCHRGVMSYEQDFIRKSKLLIKTKTGHNSIYPQLKPTKSEVHCLLDFKRMTK